MKYLIMIYSNPENWEHPIFAQNSRFRALPQEERDAVVRESDALFQEIVERGEFVTGVALADPVHTKTARAGVPATDGPYLETKEQLAGYFVVDCASPERATEIAERFPDARFGVVEVRPIMDMAGQEM